MKRILYTVVLCGPLFFQSVISQWVQVEELFDSLHIYALQSLDSLVFAGTNKGLYITRSIPGKWEKVTKQNMSVCTVKNEINYVYYGSSSILIFKKSIPNNPSFFGYDDPDVWKIREIYMYTWYDADSSLYVCEKTSGLLRWQPGWEYFNEGLPLDSVDRYTIYAIDLKGDTFFCGTDQGVYKADQHELHWVPSNNGLPAERVQLVKVLHDTVFTGIQNRLFYSIDNGNTWKLFFTSSHFITSIKAFQNRFYVATLGDGIHYTPNGGQNWHTINSGLAELSVTVLDSFQDHLICGTASEGFYYFDGHQWTRNNRGMISCNTGPIAATNESVIACVGNQIHISRKDGSWEEITPDLRSPYTVIVNLITANDTIYMQDHSSIGPFYDSIMQSPDEGRTWKNIAIPVPSLDEWNLFSVNNRLYCNYDGHSIPLHYTDNGGLTWNNYDFPAVCPGSDYTYSVHDSSLYAAGCNHSATVYRLNPDNRWYMLSEGLPQDWKGYFNYLIHTEDALYVGYYTHCFVKTDNCSHWVQVGDVPSGNNGIYNFAFSRKNLFISTYFKGVYYTDDYGRTWNSLNDGLDNTGTGALLILKDTLYLATWGDGVHFPHGTGLWKRSLSSIPLADSDPPPCLNALRYYPNPADDALYIQYGDYPGCQVKIHDLSGRMILSSDVHSAEPIHVSRIPTGIYLITLRNKDIFFSDKLLIIH